MNFQIIKIWRNRRELKVPISTTWFQDEVNRSKNELSLIFLSNRRKFLMKVEIKSIPVQFFPSPSNPAKHVHM